MGSQKFWDCLEPLRAFFIYISTLSVEVSGIIAHVAVAVSLIGIILRGLRYYIQVLYCWVSGVIL